MNTLNPNIILAGSNPDLVGAYARGQATGAQSNQIKQQNALTQLFQQQGPQIMAGDQNALNALSRFDPQAAFAMKDSHAAAADRSQRLQVMLAQEKRDLAKFNAEASAAQKADAAAKLEAAVKMGMNVGSQTEWDSLMQQRAPQFVGMFDQRNVIAAEYMSMAEILKGQEAPKPQSPEGKLFADETSGMVPAGTFEAAQSKTNAKEAQIQRLMSGGLDRQTAIGIADGRLAISRDPVTGQAQVIDKATGQPVGMPERPEPLGEPSETPRKSSMPVGTDFSDATGARGFAANLANTVSDAIGAGLIDPNNERATQAMRNLATNTMITLADGVAGRPSNFLLEQFQRLTSEPNSIWQGEGRTREKLSQTRDMIAEAIMLNQDVLQSEVTPQMRAQAQQNIARLSRILNDYDAVIESFGSRSQQGKTKSGVTWSVDQ